ncbi:MAG: hypothetical protein J6R96_02870 [Spirochaetaceae bacterium]|nr:hypothetical protein [Spirochaetaceae bacterium]
MNVQNEVNICCKKLQMELKGLGIPKAQYEAGITRLMNWSRTLDSSVDGWVSREKCSEALIIRRKFQGELVQLKRFLRKDHRMYTPVVQAQIERLEMVHKFLQRSLDKAYHSYRREDEDLWYDFSGLPN